MKEGHFGNADNIVPLEAARAERLHREASERDTYTADVALINSLIDTMRSHDVYDLLVVETARKVIDDFTRYVEVFEIYQAFEEVEQYKKMRRDLSAALAKYEGRDE
jgi:hypothetical protein